MTVSTQGPPAEIDKVMGGFRFLLELEDQRHDTKTVVGGFSRVSGMESHTEMIDYKPGNSPFLRRIPGRTYFSNLVLERGFACSSDLYNWRLRIARGSRERLSGSVIVLTQKGDEKFRYNFFDAWPVSWKGPELDSGTAETAIEHLELAIEYVEFVRAA